MAAKKSDLTARLTVLSEPMRLDILKIVSSSGTCCASDILEHFDITQPTLSHHMSVLIDNELVTATKQGRFMNYQINKPAVLELKKVLDSLCEGAEDVEVKTEKKKDKPKKKKKDKKKKK